MKFVKYIFAVSSENLVQKTKVASLPILSLTRHLSIIGNLSSVICQLSLVVKMKSYQNEK